ncbi:MAG: DUF126 domain-containing protein [Candidatus Diapherotrites archaeon]
MILKGRTIASGKVKGECLVTKQPISFFGGVDPETGIVIEKGHELEGKCIADKVLVFPHGKGSTVGTYTIYRLKKNNKAPAAMVLAECEAIVAAGAILSEIPCVDKVRIGKIKNGMFVTVDADKAKVIF